MSRKVLGRGLSALIAEEPQPKESQPDRDYLEIDVDLIRPNSEQPRTNFPDAELEELAQSIKSNGIVQPIVVRRHGNRYELVAGERRWRAAQRIALSKVPAIVKNVSDEKLLELSLIENIQRQELNPIDEARAYKKLIETLGLTQERVAEQVGKTRTFITNYLRLLKLPGKLIRLVEDRKLSVGHARALLALVDKKLQQQLARKIIKSSLSVRETEKAVNKMLSRDTAPEEKGKKTTRKDPNVKRAESKLRRLYATQVRIMPAKKGKSGKLEFEYYGEADLDRIYKLLTRK